MLSSKFSDKCKKDVPQDFRRSSKILEGQPQIFFGWTRPFLPFTTLTSAFLCVKFPGEGGWFNHFKCFEHHKSYVSDFFLLILQDPRFLFGGCKVFCLFQQIFACKKVIPKMDCIVKSNPLPIHEPRPHQSLLFWCK